MPDPSPDITPEGLHEEGLGWLLDSSFLGRMSPTAQRSVLKSACWKDYDEGERIIERGRPGQGADLLVSGRCMVMMRGQDGHSTARAQLGPGHLVGERSLLLGGPTTAEVVALSPIRALHMPAPAFRGLLERDPILRDTVRRLVELRDRSPELMQLLLEHRFLRSLGRSDLGRFLQSSALERVEAGEAVVRMGERSDDVFVVVRGRLAVYGAQGGAPITNVGPGWLFGHGAVLLEQPRSADVVATQDCELLRVPGSAFVGIVQRNPRLQRQLNKDRAQAGMPVTLGLNGSRAMLVSVYGALTGLGACTLAYAAAAALLEQDQQVVLVDLNGQRSATRLGLSVRHGHTLGVPVIELETPLVWGLQVIWPVLRSDSLRLVQALRDQPGREGFVLVSASPQARQDRAITQAADAVVFVSQDPQDTWEVPDRRGQFRVQVERVNAQSTAGAGAARNTVRLQDDRGSAERFWGRLQLSALVDKRQVLGRAGRRLARCLLGRTVGLALGGGGAWGMGHIGLLRALEEAELPIDYIAGTSFGAVVGAVYAVGGLQALDALLGRTDSLRSQVALSTLSTRAIGRFVDDLTGSCALGATELPFYPVAADVLTGRQVVLTRGTVGEGVRSSSGMPGVFPPMRVGNSRLVDGGVVNNVPASVVWEAGADFVLACNVVPPTPPVRRMPKPGGAREFVERWTVARLDDLQRAMYLMMWQGGLERSRKADFVFDLDLGRWRVFDFQQGSAIATSAEAQARRRVAELQRAYSAHGLLLR